MGFELSEGIDAQEVFFESGKPLKSALPTNLFFFCSSRFKRAFLVCVDMHAIRGSESHVS